MYSWSDYESAMKKINNSLLPKNARSNKAWVRFPINEIPLSNDRLSQLLNQIESSGYSRKRFLPHGYKWGDELVSYDYYLNKLGNSVKNTKKKWKSHATEIGSVYVLANKWILPTPKFPTLDIMVYWFDENNKIQKFNIGNIINEFFNSLNFTDGEEKFWRGGLNPATYNQGYSLKPHGNGDDAQYFWHPDKEGYVNMRDLKAITEAVYRRGETIEPVDSEEAFRQIWSVKWIHNPWGEDTENVMKFDGQYKKNAEEIHQAYQFASPVIEPPRTQWIINYNYHITQFLKS